MLSPRRRALTLAPGALALAALLVGCAGTTPATTTTPDPTATQEPAAVTWGYEGDTGPEHWGDLSPEFALCATGAEQTPIDLSGAEQEDIADVAFAYQGAPLKVLNNGHTIQVPSDGASSITVGGTTYDLGQFHFHTPSEHTVDGNHFDAELHLVHQDADDRLAVVAVLIGEGAENEAVAPILDNLPAEAGQELGADGVTLDPADLLPDSLLTYQYTGSLTTPPCSEDVSWFVLTAPIELSAAQLASLESTMGHNNRPLQPTNDRELLEDTVTG